MQIIIRQARTTSEANAGGAAGVREMNLLYNTGCVKYSCLSSTFAFLIEYFCRSFILPTKPFLSTFVSVNAAD